MKLKSKSYTFLDDCKSLNCHYASMKKEGNIQEYKIEPHAWDGSVDIYVTPIKSLKFIKIDVVVNKYF